MIENWLKLTDESFDSLLSDGVPEAVLSRLKPLKNMDLRREQLLAEIEKRLDKDELERWSDRILKYAVEEGVKPGERVVVSGLQRVKSGTKVEPKLTEMTVEKTARDVPLAPRSSDGVKK